MSTCLSSHINCSSLSMILVFVRPFHCFPISPGIFSSSRSLFHNSLWLFRKCLNSQSLIFGQNQQPFLGENSYTGDNKPYFLQRLYAIFSVCLYFSSKDILFPSSFASRFGSSMAIPICWVNSLLKLFRYFLSDVPCSYYLPGTCLPLGNQSLNRFQSVSPLLVL